MFNVAIDGIKHMMKKKTPLSDMTWSVKDRSTFIQNPTIHQLMIHNPDYIEREIDYVDHNYTSDGSSV